MVDSKITSFEQLLTTTKPQKVALLHDWLVGGGSEKVIEQLHAMFPEAPIYTSYCTDEWLEKLDGKIVTGYLQKWPFSNLRKFLPLLRQRWFSRLDLSGFDLIISSSGNGEAKFAGIKSKGPNPRHVCYCHSPTHFYWRHYDNYLKNPGFRPYWLVRLGLKALVKPLRKREYAAAQKVDHFIANSSHIQRDIKKYYNRSSTVIHPPVEVNGLPYSKPHHPDPGSCITLSRLVPHKHTDVIIKACNELKLPLKIIGSGPERQNLEKIAGETVQFLGFVDDEEKFKHLAAARAFVFASFEDFGVCAVEAMAVGTPVIAFKDGGALDYVKPGVTGKFFDEQTADSLIETLKSFDPANYSSSRIRKAAQEFSNEKFKEKIEEFLSTINLWVS